MGKGLRSLNQRDGGSKSQRARTISVKECVGRGRLWGGGGGGGEEEGRKGRRGVLWQ